MQKKIAWKIAGRSLEAPTTSAAQSVVLLHTNFYKAPIFFDFPTAGFFADFCEQSEKSYVWLVSKRDAFKYLLKQHELFVSFARKDIP